MAIFSFCNKSRLFFMTLHTTVFSLITCLHMHDCNGWFWSWLKFVSPCLTYVWPVYFRTELLSFVINRREPLSLNSGTFQFRGLWHEFLILHSLATPHIWPSESTAFNYTRTLLAIITSTLHYATLRFVRTYVRCVEEFSACTYLYTVFKEGRSLTRNPYVHYLCAHGMLVKLLIIKFVHIRVN